MKVYDAASLRNAALVGHTGSGKTQLASAVLSDTGMINRFGKVDEGTTVTDYDEEEIARKHTLSASLAYAEWNKQKINLIDTPGIGNFLSEARAALHVADAALVVVDAVAGVMVQTEKVWQAAEELGLPRLVVLNRLDRERASLPRSLQSLHDLCHRTVIPIQLPIGEEKSLRGIVDLVTKKAFIFESDGSGKFAESAIPADMTAEVDTARDALIEMVAEADETLMERFFEAGTLTDQELVGGLRAATAAAKLFPLVCTSAIANIGVPQLLDAVLSYLPSPADRPYKGVDKDGVEVRRRADEKAPVEAFVWKTIADPFAGRITMFRVVCGTLKVDSTVQNKTRDTPERLGHLVLLQGQIHIEVTVAKLKRRFGVDVNLKPPRIPYRETIKASTEAHGRHKKQTGGHGQFGDCKIRMEPLARGADFEFVDDIFGGSIPRQFVPAVEKGIQDTRLKGYLAGYPVVDFKVTLTDGKFHAVDSNELSFRMAGRLAFKDAMSRARPTILEPIMNVEVYAPADFAGDLMGDLNGRRGRIAGMDTRGAMTIIKAQVPMSEMLTYEQHLTSATGGRGTYHMEYSHYEEVPQHQQAKIIAAARAEKGQ